DRLVEGLREGRPLPKEEEIGNGHDPPDERLLADPLTGPPGTAGGRLENLPARDVAPRWRGQGEDALPQRIFDRQGVPARLRDEKESGLHGTARRRAGGSGGEGQPVVVGDPAECAGGAEGIRRCAIARGERGEG